MSQTPPDVIVIMTDQERATPPYESDELRAWRDEDLGPFAALNGTRMFPVAASSSWNS